MAGATASQARAGNAPVGKWPFGCQGEPTDVLSPTGDMPIAISKLLERAEVDAGEYSFGGQADALPAIPGLVVDGVGAVPVPLSPERAEKLVARCEKSPFGRQLETLMDESVRRSWQLEPVHVTMTNPAWQRGMDQLSKTVADRLGYKGIAMQSVLYKLLVYGEGGHFVKHQDTEKEDGMVATLVVQLPSENSGGDLVVYRGRDVEYRHDFGKADGSAAFLPHYAVHYADAEHALQPVRSGYRLVLVYSLCLPAEMRHLVDAKGVRPLSEDLADILFKVPAAVSPVVPVADDSKLKKEEESFALLLSHQYTTKSIVDRGFEALKGVDRARFQALLEANSLVPPEKTLDFYIARLDHKINSYDCSGIYHKDRWKPEHAYWEEDYRCESVCWLSIKGEQYGDSKQTMKSYLYPSSDNLERELAPNFLNPGRATLSELWKSSNSYGGYMGNEGATRETTYARYAIFGWPSVKGVELAMKIIGQDVAVTVLQGQGTVDTVALRSFMDTVSTKVEKRDGPVLKSMFGGTRQEKAPVSVHFCTRLCELLVDAGDTGLATAFFSKFFDRMKDVTGFGPSVVLLLRNFSWDDVGQAIVNSFTELPDGVGLELVLEVVDGLESGKSQTSLFEAAVEMALKLPESILSSLKSVNLLWKWSLRCESKPLFDKVVRHFKQMDPSSLGTVVEGFALHVGDLDKHGDKFTAVIAVAGMRLHWLNEEIAELDKPFSWSMPYAKYPSSARVERFLRGPEARATIDGFASHKEAKRFAEYIPPFLTDAKNASYKMDVSGKKARLVTVTITKTREWYDRRHTSLTKYKTEATFLAESFGEAVSAEAVALRIRDDQTNATGKKRRRDEPADFSLW